MLHVLWIEEELRSFLYGKADTIIYRSIIIILFFIHLGLVTGLQEYNSEISQEITSTRHPLKNAMYVGVFLPIT